MSTEIQGQSFNGVVGDCSDVQKDFLALLVKGVEKPIALAMIGRGDRCWREWREHKEYLAIEEHIVGNKEKYYYDVEAHFRGKLATVEMGLLNLAGKIVYWDTLEPGEKGYVLRACSMIRALRPVEKQGRGYEERLKDGA